MRSPRFPSTTRKPRKRRMRYGGAIRAVHERMIFARERQEWARRTGNAEDVAIEQARIDENQRLADVLRRAVGAALSTGELE